MQLPNLLAEATQQTVQAPWYAHPENLMLPLIVGMLLFLMFTSSQAKKNEQKTRDEMLSKLKRGDRVMTAGGMLGTVVDVRDNEVVLKVDESTNTKIKFSREAIKRVLADDELASAK